MLALKARRRLGKAWWSLDVTVEEGLRRLEQLCVMELLDNGSGQVLARQLRDPDAGQKQLLDALGLGMPGTVPEAKAVVVARKKISQRHKPLAK